MGSLYLFEMKFFLVLAAMLALACALPEMMIANRADFKVGDYSTIQQTVCHDSACSKSCKSTTFATGKCIQDSSGGFIMTCSDDGSTFNQTQYSDTACTTQTGAVPGTCDQCYNAGVLTYVEFECQA